MKKYILFLMMAFAALFVSCANDSSEDKEEKEGIEGFYTYTTVENGTKKTYFIHIDNTFSPEEDEYYKYSDSISVGDTEKKFDLNSEFLLPGIDAETKLFRNSKLLEYLKTQEEAGNGVLVNEGKTWPFYFPNMMSDGYNKDENSLYSYTDAETGITYYFTMWYNEGFLHFFTQERLCTDEEVRKIFKLKWINQTEFPCEADLDVMRQCNRLCGNSEGEPSCLNKSNPYIPSWYWEAEW